MKTEQEIKERAAELRRVTFDYSSDVGAQVAHLCNVLASVEDQRDIALEQITFLEDQIKDRTL
jgi:hypothetical protein